MSSSHTLLTHREYIANTCQYIIGMQKLTKIKLLYNTRKILKIKKHQYITLIDMLRTCRVSKFFEKLYVAMSVSCHIQHLCPCQCFLGKNPRMTFKISSIKNSKIILII